MGQKRKVNSPSINNRFYDELNEAWYSAEDHPIALLRAENALRNPWILQTLKEYELKQPRLSSRLSVLDLGCGGGLLSNFLAQANYQVTGIDLSLSSISLAQRKDATQTVRYLQGDVKALPFENQSFDVVCAMDLLEHVEEPNLVIKEASRVLKPQGLFFFHTFNRTFWSYLLVIKCVEWLVPNVPEHMHVYSLFIRPKELTQYCRNAHLQVNTLRGLAPKIPTRAFLKSLKQRKIDPDFPFHFTSSLKTGYVGIAVRLTQGTTTNSP